MLSITFVFPTFKVSLLAVNHSFASLRFWLTFSSSVCRDSSAFNNVVSSANRVVSRLTEFGRSFMYMMKSSGPSMEPWGTPHSISNQSDIVS